MKHISIYHIYVCKFEHLCVCVCIVFGLGLSALLRPFLLHLLLMKISCILNVGFALQDKRASPSFVLAVLWPSAVSASREQLLQQLIAKYIRSQVMGRYLDLMCLYVCTNACQSVFANFSWLCVCVCLFVLDCRCI